MDGPFRVDLRRLSGRQRGLLLALAVLLGAVFVTLAGAALQPENDPAPRPNPEQITLAFNLPPEVVAASETPAPTNTLVLRETPATPTPRPTLNLPFFIYTARPTVTYGPGTPSPEVVLGPPTETPTPGPSPTYNGSFAVPRGWPGSYPGLSKSKLSIHIILTNDPYESEFVRRAHPRLIKSVGDYGFLRDTKLASPGTLTLGRSAGQDETWVYALDPVTAAKDFIALNLESYKSNPWVDFWEGWNEYLPQNAAQWQWFTTFESVRVCAMQSQGLHAAVGTFPAGTPEYKDMARFLPALEAAYRCGGILTLHEGVMPIIGCGVAINNPSVMIPGAPTFPNVPVGYMTARYRYWYEGYLKPIGMGDLPLVISELAVGGFVPGSPCNGPGGNGLDGAAWKNYSEWWVAQGLAPTGAQAFVKVLSWYDTLMRADSYVIGATIFTAGAGGADDIWHPFDLHDVMLPLADYMNSVK